MMVVNGQKTWTSALMKVGAVVATVAAGLTLWAPITLIYAIYSLCSMLINLLYSTIVPGVLMIKVLHLTEDFIDKRKELGIYLKEMNAGDAAGRANAMRVEEASKLVNAMEELVAKNRNPDKNERMPDDLREQLIAFYSDEKNDMKQLMETAKDIQNKAKKSMKQYAQELTPAPIPALTVVNEPPQQTVYQDTTV